MGHVTNDKSCMATDADAAKVLLLEKPHKWIVTASSSRQKNLQAVKQLC